MPVTKIFKNIWKMWCTCQFSIKDIFFLTTVNIKFPSTFKNRIITIFMENKFILKTSICNNYKIEALERNTYDIKINQINVSDITTSNKKQSLRTGEHVTPTQTTYHLSIRYKVLLVKHFMTVKLMRTGHYPLRMSQRMWRWLMIKLMIKLFQPEVVLYSKVHLRWNNKLLVSPAGTYHYQPFITVLPVCLLFLQTLCKLLK